MEVKNATLRTWESGEAMLLMVDADYGFHSVSGHVEALRMLLQDVELPNVTWVHNSGGRAYYAEGHKYKGRYLGGKGLSLLEQYRKKDSAA